MTAIPAKPARYDDFANLVAGKNAWNARGSYALNDLIGAAPTFTEGAVVPDTEAMLALYNAQRSYGGDPRALSMNTNFVKQLPGTYGPDTRTPAWIPQGEVNFAGAPGYTPAD